MPYVVWSLIVLVGLSIVAAGLAQAFGLPAAHVEDDFIWLILVQEVV